MDPADPIQKILSNQGMLLGNHEQMLRALCNQNFTTQVSELAHQLASLAISTQAEGATRTNPPAPTGETRCDPESFSRDLDKCQGFLLQCGLIFQQCPRSFNSDAAKIYFVVGLLQGRALAWAEALSSLTSSDFESRLKAVFDHPNHRSNASSPLLSLRQGSRSVADYSVDFWTLVMDAGWNDAALQEVFVKGLNEQLKDELAAQDEPSTLSALVSLAIRLDNRLREWCQVRAACSPRSTHLACSRPARLPATGVAA